MKKRWEVYKSIKCGLIRMLADESDASIDAIALTAKNLTDPSVNDEDLFNLYFINYTGDDKYFQEDDNNDYAR